MNETHDTLAPTPGANKLPSPAPPPSANAAITVTHEDSTVAYELRVTGVHPQSYEARWALTDQLVEMLMNGEGVEGMIAARLIEGVLAHTKGEFRRAQARELLQKWDNEHLREADEVDALNTEVPPAAA